MDTIPQSLAGVGLTAVGVALIRARESQRPDRLFEDPYAQLFADAAEADFLGSAAPAGAAESWTRMLDLVDRFYDGRVVATRYFDDYLDAALIAGCRQVVNLGAGLDTRALRLPAAREVPFFELDQPAMFAFKERVLSARPGSPRRVVVPTDLTGEWFADLLAAGFDTDQPTAWLEEGVLAYLSPRHATAVLEAITATSKSGSRLAKTAMPPPRPEDETYQRMRSFVGASPQTSAGVSGVDRDNAYRLGEQGWTLSVDNHAELAARYARTVPDAPGVVVQGEYVRALKT